MYNSNKFKKKKFRRVKIKSIYKNRLIFYKRPKKKILIFFYILLLFLICLFCYIFIRIKKKIKLKNIEKAYKDKINKLKILLPQLQSSSQTFEDLVLFYVFYDLDKGFYIDVGANDPHTFSTTKVFYTRGWNGINIEPLPDKFQLLTQYRTRDINLNIGIGQNQRNATLMIDGYNGCKSSLIYNKEMINPRRINIKIDTVANICKQFVPSGKKIDFLKIDVEGSEKEVLLGIDFVNYRPNVICIESLNSTENNNMPEYLGWENILIENDYAFAYVYWINRFYYDKKIKGMKEKFRGVEHFTKSFKKD